MPATPSVKRSQFHANPDGSVSVQLHGGSFLSIQPDGSLQTRTAIGPWESGRDEQNKWVVSDSAYPTGSYAILIADE